MQGIADISIKLILISALEHYAQIIAVGPISLGAHLLSHAFVESCPGKRVRKRNSDIIGMSPAHQRNGLLNVLPGFSGISKLQEITSADSFPLQILACGN